MRAGPEPIVRPRQLLLLVCLSFAIRVFGDACPSVDWTLKQTRTHAEIIDDLRTIDYDHDGKLDLVGTLNGAVHRWRGLGDATFETPVSLDEFVADVQIVDLNNDDYDDLVGAGSNQVWVRFGNAGGFDPAISTFTNYTPNRLQVGDFNEGDATIDLIVTARNPGLIVVYQGNANGSFTESRRVDVGFNDWVMDHVVADFDNDGRFDVALARYTSHQTEVYFRNSDGTFAAAVSLDGGPLPQGVVAGDFNKDGFADLATVSWEDGAIDVFTNNGDRTFSDRQILSARSLGSFAGLSSVAVTDINGDTNPDLLATGINAKFLMVTFPGDGTGGFHSPTWIATQENMLSLATGNFDGDSDLEVALGGYQKFFTADYGCGPQIHLYTTAPVTSVGQTANIRAVVSGISQLMPSPRGTVAFKEGSTVLATIDVDATGTAAFDTNDLAAGEHTITAEFSGNASVGPVASTSIVQKVVTTASSITIDLAPSFHGKPFSSPVVFRSREGMVTTVYYRLTVDGFTESRDRRSEDPLTLTLSLGPHTIRADYAGSVFETPSTSTYHFTTQKHPSDLVKSGDVAARLNAAHLIQVSFGSMTTPAPTGIITLMRGATEIATAAINDGAASFAVALRFGTYDYTAVYAGDTYYASGSITFPLTVLANAPVVIDARSAGAAIFVPAVVPDGTTSAVLYRRLHSPVTSWTAVPSWSLQSPFDTGPLSEGVLYDYRVDATAGDLVQVSNVDAALIFTDPTLTAGSTTVKLVHFTQLRDSVNALRAVAGLAPFGFDDSFQAGGAVGASHLAGLRTAVNQARTVLGLGAATFTDASVVGVNVKRVHLTEIRDAAQ